MTPYGVIRISPESVQMTPCGVIAFKYLPKIEKSIEIDGVLIAKKLNMSRFLS